MTARDGDDDDRHLSGLAIRRRYGVSSATLRRWDAKGLIATMRSPGGKRFYRAVDVATAFGQKQQPRLPPEKKRVGYARVSSGHQRADLERQIADLRSRDRRGLEEVVSDVGSGLSWKRRGFLSLLDRVHSGDVGEVVVLHRDRLCRFAVELVEWIFKKAGCRLVVLGADDDAPGSRPDGRGGTAELADDLLSVVTVFVARHNGQRSGDNRRRRKREAEAAEAAEVQKERKRRRAETSSGESEEDSDLSDDGAEGSSS